MKLYSTGFRFDHNRILLLFLVSTMIYGTKARTKLRQNDRVFAIQAFGDSILDTGNNNDLVSVTKCNFSPYGRDFIGGEPTGRFCNGRVLSDIMAEGIGIKQILPPWNDKNLSSQDLQTGLCFASGGSGYDPLSSKINRVLPLSFQLENFKEYKAKLEEAVGKQRSDAIIGNSLYLISGGNNDILFSYFVSSIRRSRYDVPTYTNMLIDWASTFFKELYDLGARKFAILNAVPLGCFPFSRTTAGGVERNCADEYNDVAQMFNAKLSSKLNAMSRELDHSTMVYIDFYNPLLDIILASDKYGFEVSNKGCCGSGAIEIAVLCNEQSPNTCTNTSQYVFWDALHPSEGAYKLVASKLLPQLYE